MEDKRRFRINENPRMIVSVEIGGTFTDIKWGQA